MKINTLMAEEPEHKTLAATIPGDVFRFGSGMEGIGLKLDQGFVLVQSCTGKEAYEYHHPDQHKENFPVIVIGGIVELVLGEE